MADIVLHHYPPSLFSEKVRLLLGYLDLEWHSVVISPVMPRPLLMPLSGGYRKTPIMQMGADVYCDSEIICRTLAERAGNALLYAHGFAADRFARWADTELFRIAVALNFRPEALAVQMSQMSQTDIEAFQKDRAELAGGAPMVGLDPATATAQFQGLLNQLEASLSQSYLFGDEPAVADFALYHNLWFVAGNAANRSLFDARPQVRAYLERMSGFGHGREHALRGEDALAIARDAQPVRPQHAVVDSLLAGDIRVGDHVTVAPSDYGRVPVEGRLISWGATEIVIERDDEQAGRVQVHFPNVGFEVHAR